MKKKPDPPKKKKAQPGGLRRAARLLALAAALVLLLLAALGDWYVHHPNDWLAAHRSPLTAPLEYLGDRAGMLTDALGWTGHDCVYESDDPAPAGQVFFAGAPRRTGEPAPNDVQLLDRGPFVVGWSPSLRHPAWVAYHVPATARFEAGKRPNFQRDRSVAASAAPGDYAGKGYDRGHMAPNRALVTRFGPDIQKRSFLMSNIAPQRPALNRGPWRELEQRIADLWTARYGEIWVIAGALSKPSARAKLPGTAIDVPTDYWMLIAAQTPDGVRALALKLSQRAGYRDFPVHNIVTVDELEAETGWDFFPDMPRFLQTPLEADRPTRLWPVNALDLIKLLLIRIS